MLTELLAALTAEQFYVLAVLGSAMMLMSSGRLRNDLVAMLVLLSLALGGIVTPDEAFSGFARPAILTLAGLFILTAAMRQAGIVHWIGEQLEKLTGGSETKMMLVFILVGAALSLVVNTAAAGAVLLPAVVAVARRNDVPVSKVLMPMGFGVIVGGTATIFTTANIIMSSLLQAQGHASLTMWDFFPTGGALVIVSTIYLLTIGRKLLPANAAERAGKTALDLSGVYQLEDRLWELRVLPESPLAGKTLAEARLPFPLLAIWRGHDAEFNPGAKSRLEVGDIVLASGPRDRLDEMKEYGLAVGRKRKLGGRDMPVTSVEVVIPPRSKLSGQSLADIGFQTRFGLTAVALWRAGQSQRSDVGTTKLQIGDALLVVGSLKKVLELTLDHDYLVVDTPAYPAMSYSQTAWTLAVTVGVVFAAGLDVISMSLAAVAGAVTLVLLGLLTVERAYASIDWSVLTLIAGLAPLAVALQKTGLTALVGHAFETAFPDGQRLLPMAALYLLTVVATQVLGGQVSALFTGPIALALAVKLNLNLTAVAVLVAVACSNCFITIVAHPVNMLISGPGGYRNSDFLRVGLGLQVVCFAAAMAMAHYYWGI